MTTRYFQPLLREGSYPIATDPDGLLVTWKPNLQQDLTPAEGEFKPYHFGDRLVYITGRRGCGKSTYVSMYMKGFRQASDRRIFFISRLAEDDSIQLPSRSMRMNITEIEGTRVEDFQNSLMVFDDIHSASLTPKQQSFIQAFIIDALENSRHYQISLLVTSHLITNYSKTRAILNELSDLVVYPGYSNAKQIEYALTTYLGLGKPEVARVMRNTDRWVMVHPIGDHKFVLSSHHLWSLDSRWSSKQDEALQLKGLTVGEVAPVGPGPAPGAPQV